jgi:hypothetical protein
LLDISMDKIVDNDFTVQFWNDRWFHITFFSHEYSALFSIVTHPHILVSLAFELGQLKLHFNYTLDEDYLTEWKTLNIALKHFTLKPILSDTVKFRWTFSDLFSVHTMHDWLQYGGIINSDYLPIWNAKLPLKIKKISLVGKKK